MYRICHEYLDEKSHGDQRQKPDVQQRGLGEIFGRVRTMRCATSVLIRSDNEKMRCAGGRDHVSVIFSFWNLAVSWRSILVHCNKSSSDDNVDCTNLYAYWNAFRFTFLLFQGMLYRIANIPTSLCPLRFKSLTYVNRLCWFPWAMEIYLVYFDKRKLTSVI